MAFVKFHYFFHIGKPEALSFYIMDVSGFFPEEFFKNFGFVVGFHPDTFIRNFDNIVVPFVAGFNFNLGGFRGIFIGIIQKVYQCI